MSTRTPGRKDTATSPKASAECEMTPSVVSIAQPRAASVATVAAMASATSVAPATTGNPVASASATPRMAACAVASPK